MCIESFLVGLSKQLCSQAAKALNNVVLVSPVKVWRQVIEFFPAEELSFGIPPPDKGKTKVVEHTIMR
jgi:hypothetical protein